MCIDAQIGLFKKAASCTAHRKHHHFICLDVQACLAVELCELILIFCFSYFELTNCIVRISIFVLNELAQTYSFPMWFVVSYGGFS